MLTTSSVVSGRRTHDGLRALQAVDQYQRGQRRPLTLKSASDFLMVSQVSAATPEAKSAPARRTGRLRSFILAFLWRMKAAWYQDSTDTFRSPIPGDATAYIYNGELYTSPAFKDALLRLWPGSTVMVASSGEPWRQEDKLWTRRGVISNCIRNANFQLWRLVRPIQRPVKQ